MSSTTGPKMSRAQGKVKKRRRVLVLSLGGTIASTRASGGVSPTLTGRELVQAVPSLRTLASVEAEAMKAVASTELTIADAFRVAKRVDGALRRGTSGVVITQGTDTLEEMAFALDLLLDVDRPVVVTGAMRTADEPGADGPANLLASVRVALCNEARDLGVVVVVSDEIHAARYARKVHTTRVSAFASPGLGPLGWIVEGKPRIFWKPFTRPNIKLGSLFDSQPKVALIPVSLGDDGTLLRNTVELGFHGVVLEAAGAGHVPAVVAEVAGRVAKSIPVVVTSRIGTGPILQSTYAYPGSESDLQRRGVIPGAALDGAKARLVLTLLLMSRASTRRIGATFAQFAGVA